MIIKKIEEAGIIPIFSNPSAKVSLAVVRAAYAAGVRVFEYTNRNATALATTKLLLATRPAEFPDMLLGIGTVFDPKRATDYLDAGIDFLVAPICNPAVGTLCRARNVPWLPGCMTVTEVYQAREAGASFIKIFPGEVVGPAFVKAIRAVLPDVKLMVTGGVEPTPESLGRWFSAGATGVGMGAHLFNPQAVAAGDWAAISNTIKQTLTILTSIR